VTQSKAFQSATVEAALVALRSKTGPRKFLVADEVGLGKTVVAQGIVREMMRDNERRDDGPLVVFYVCSSLAIAAQNRRKLLELLPRNEWNDALCPVDRLTLVGTKEPPAHRRLHLYTLTPDTSVPTREGRSRRGQQTERALVFALVKHRFPNILRIFRQDDFRSKRWKAASEDVIWRSLVRSYKRIVRDNAALRREFYAAMRDELGLSEGQWTLPAIAAMKDDPLELIGKLRSALAAANLNKIHPQLVIFDEFQRFRDLVREYDDADFSLPEVKGAQSRVARLLRGEQMEDPPGLLLLSATPYKPYAKRWEEADGGTHRLEFLKLVQFLYGSGSKGLEKRQMCEAAFDSMETELRLGRLESAEFKQAKSQIQELLRPVISRTERLAHPDGWETAKLRNEMADLHVRDLRVYKHLAESFSDGDKSWAVPFWVSVPMPAQTMGPGYLAWKRRKLLVESEVPAITREQRNRFVRPHEWPHPRLRALERIMPAERLAIPWLAPSLPWWNLGGAWKNVANENASPGKLLVFSRFRAVPQAVAALLSYSLECRFLRNARFDYESASKRSVLQPRAKREALVALFHPSPWLIEATDPLASKAGSERGICKELSRQIRAALDEAGIRVAGDSRRPLWRLLAKLETRFGTWRQAYQGWASLGKGRPTLDDSEPGALIELVERWDEEARSERIGEISPIELERLAEYALTAPGVVLGRALRRHWPEAVSEIGFLSTLEASWLGLRNYLDQPWFVKALGGGERHYPDSIQQAIFDGNLESVLDEQLWIVSKMQSLSGAQLAEELRDALRLRSSVFFLHSASDPDERFTMRCHAALPFTEARTIVQMPGEPAEKPLRPDELRKAFNSPFWPYVLSTTSIGQEGLDFHCWCKTLVHWDLAPDPVSHEQRQGRIQRYGGLAIRSRIAQLLGADVLGTARQTTSPWQDLALRAESTIADASGLKPWWILDGAETENVMLSVPTSEQEAHYKWLQEQVLLYRLALGHPNQEDLLEVLRRNHDITAEQVRTSSLELSAYFGR